MVRFATRLARGVLIAALSAIVAAPAALAASPSRAVQEVDLFNAFPAGTRCAIDVERTITAVFVETVFTDADGLTRVTHLYRGGKIVYTNPANGKAISANLAGPAVYIDNGDGTTTVRIPGNSQLYTAPGLGFVIGNAGLSIVTIDTATQEVLSTDKLAGHQDGTTFPGFCVGLE